LSRAPELRIRCAIVPAVSVREDAMDNLQKKGTADRSKINMSEAFEVKYWTKELGISREKLQQLVDKVGNSAAAVRKELSH
jgi:3-oxoacyl-[acyl-carrier-protein] synthase III